MKPTRRLFLLVDYLVLEEDFKATSAINRDVQGANKTQDVFFYNFYQLQSK